MDRKWERHQNSVKAPVLEGGMELVDQYHNDAMDHVNLARSVLKARRSVNYAPLEDSVTKLGQPHSLIVSSVP